ncbi:MAG: hypothetical protein JXR91_04490 [Deltaproteobacteria bacterium]|nr:hypothetical protein [Deltaproteobacteria bacterium]
MWFKWPPSCMVGMPVLVSNQFSIDSLSVALLKVLVLFVSSRELIPLVTVKKLFCEMDYYGGSWKFRRAQKNTGSLFGAIK